MKAIAPFSDRADRTVVAGRVLVGFPRCMPDCTGLNALACIKPVRLVLVAASGRAPRGRLLEQLKTGEVSAEGLRIVLERVFASR